MNALTHHNQNSIQLLLAIMLGLFSISAASGQIFVTDTGNGTTGAGSIGEYPISGGSGNASFVSGLTNPYGITAVGSDLFVAYGSKIVEYNSSGGVVNPSVVSGLTGADYIASSGSDLFVTQFFSNGSSEISEFNTSGGVVNPSIALPAGSSPLTGLAVSGSNVFVVDYGTGTIGEYTTSLALENASFITDTELPLAIAASATDIYVFNGGNGLVSDYSTSGTLESSNFLSSSLPVSALAVSGSDLFVLSQYVGSGTVGEYSTTGGDSNPSLIQSVPGYEDGLTVVAVPEPSTYVTLLGGLCLLAFFGNVRARR